MRSAICYHIAVQSQGFRAIGTEQDGAVKLEREI